MTIDNQHTATRVGTGGCCGAASERRSDMQEGEITMAVRERYGAIAAQVLNDAEQSASCGCCGSSAKSQITRDLYLDGDLEGLPLKAALASLGCGNPTALAELHPGEVVLDLGSGGGIDVLLSARRVGPTGFAYGLDMTDEMLELARRNVEEAGVSNVAFLKGDISNIPLPDASVDVVISNCVINLSENKDRVLNEAFRVLKPGGRFAISDIVIDGELPKGVVDEERLRRDLESWAGCIAGALTSEEYREGLSRAGFVDIGLEITRRYTANDIPDSLTQWANQLDASTIEQVVERFTSSFVRATKPVV